MRLTIGMSRRWLAPLAAVGAVAFGSPAHAVIEDQGVWDSGSAKVVCDTGTLRRKCTYTFTASNCTEAYVNGMSVLPCGAKVNLSVQIVPIFNGLGQTIGCTSIALDEQNFGTVEYNSSIDRYDRVITVDWRSVHVRDIFADGKQGVVTFAGTSGNQIETWTTQGTFQQTCQRNANRTITNMATAPGAVTVDVGPSAS